MIKNISKAEVLVLKDQVAYQEGQVVSKTLAQNDALSVTLFSFEIIFVSNVLLTKEKRSVHMNQAGMHL